MDVGQAFDFTLNSAKELHGLWEIYFFGITQLQQSLHPFGTPLKIQVILFGAPEISDQLKEIHEFSPGSGFSHGSGMGLGFPLLEALGISRWFGNMKQSQSKGVVTHDVWFPAHDLLSKKVSYSIHVILYGFSMVFLYPKSSFENPKPSLCAM